MRHGFMQTAKASAIVIMLAAGAPASTQEAEEPPLDLGVYALQLIESSGSSLAFEPVSDTRYIIARHLETGFRCVFLPDSEAFVGIVTATDPTTVGDDAMCVDRTGDSVMDFRISRHPGATIEEVFAEARAEGNAFFDGTMTETDELPILTESPNDPSVKLDMPRMQTAMFGAADDGQALLRTAVVRRPGDWFIRQRYFAILPAAETDSLETWAEESVKLAEAVFAARLGDMIAPTVDPALPTLEEVLQSGER